MLHQPIHTIGEFWNRTFGLFRIYLGKPAKRLHLAIQHLVSALDIFHEFAGIDVGIATIGNVVDHFGRNQDRSDRGSGRVGGVVRGKIGERSERTGKIDAVDVNLSDDDS